MSRSSDRPSEPVGARRGCSGHTSRHNWSARFADTRTILARGVCRLRTVGMVGNTATEPNGSSRTQVDPKEATLRFEDMRILGYEPAELLACKCSRCRWKRTDGV